MKSKISKVSQYGSMMVEALAMLGLITMITPVLYKKAAERTTELQDINTASQMRTLSKALDDFIMDNYEDISAGDEGEILIDKEDILPYLPYNFNVDQSKLFGEYQFALRNDIINAGTEREHSAITGMVLAPSLGAANLPMIRASKIASMVGANGGLVDKTKGNNIQGVQGAWQANLEDFGFSDDAENGSLVVSSIHAVTSSGGGADSVVAENVLFRDASKGPEYNTMMTTLYMNNNDIEGVNSITAKEAEEGGTGSEVVTIGPNLAVSGSVTAGADVTATGAITAGTDVTATGAITAGTDVTAGANITATGNITASGGGFKVEGGNITTTGNIVASNEQFKVDESGNVRAVAGNFSGGVVAEGVASAINPDGTPGSLYSDDEYTSYSLVSAGNLLVNANAHVTGDVKIGESLKASSLFGDDEIGGGKIDEFVYNFTADSDNVNIYNPSFKVGEYDERLVTNSEEAYLAKGNVRIKAGNEGGVDVAKMSVGSTYMSLNDGSMNLRVPDELGAESSIIVSNGNTIFSNKGGEGVTTKGLAQITPKAIDIKLRSKDEGGSIISALSLYENKAGIEYEKGELSITDDELSLAHNPSGTTESKLVLRDGNVSLISDETGNVSLNAGNDSGNVYLNAVSATGAILANTNDFIIDEDPVLQESAQGGNIYDNRITGVRINRAGIIQLPASKGEGSVDLGVEEGFQDVPGYIKLDRIIANQAYPKFGDSWGVGDGDYDTETSTPYDAYQLNPAYTSVMHDIKLTTRGGARLSDILPDFINKGIYVLDNTYKEEKGKTEWDVYEVHVGSQVTINNGPGECAPNDMDCIASPWLGFIPAPQCPPGYSKVITINPIRWKMAEAFYIPTGVTPTATNVGKKFREYFVPRTNPLNAGFQLSSGSGENHTHVVTSGWPLTFQTNTWLNTTISGVYGIRDGDHTAQESTDENPGRKYGFIGWHAIMGFLYNGYDYSDYLTVVGQNPSDYEGKIVWNLFPVYNQEMTAIANVYCYFERRDMSGAIPKWSWNSDYVDNYDQISNFRLGFERNKNSGYGKRLNDPALGYDEVW